MKKIIGLILVLLLGSAMLATAQITVTNPVAGFTVTNRDSLTIRWSTASNITKFNLYLSSKDLNDDKVIATNILSKDYTWQVSYCGFNPRYTNYHIVVYGIDQTTGQEVYGSSGSFRIVIDPNKQPSVKIIKEAFPFDDGYDYYTIRGSTDPLTYYSVQWSTDLKKGWNNWYTNFTTTGIIYEGGISVERTMPKAFFKLNKL